MTNAIIHLPGDVHSHAHWLHELRSAVSTASVAAVMGRRLVHDDARTAEDVLRDAEQALSQCRDLLAAAAEHVREDDASRDAPPAGTRLSLRGVPGERRSAAAPRMSR